MSTITTTTEAPATTDIHVTVTYKLSPEGQKAALLAGKNAAAHQELAGIITADLLDMCKINKDGTVTADYLSDVGITDKGELSGGGYGYAVYRTAQDAPAESASDLLTRLRDGIRAKRVEVKAAYEQRQAEERARNEAKEAEYQAWLTATQQAMDADPQLIPSVNPPHRHFSWADSDVPVAVEIRRRKKLKAEADKRAEEQAAIAKHNAIRAWLAEHGTEDQMERFDADLLPEDEYRAAMADFVFAPLAEFPVYQKLSAKEVRDAAGDDWRDSELEAEFRTVDPDKLTASQWKLLKTMRAACPAAKIKPTLHQGTLDSNDVPWGVIERNGAIAEAEVAGVKVRREYAL